MKLLDKYIKAVEALEEYFGEEEFSWYGVTDCREDFWQVDGEQVLWAKSEEEVISQDGECYGQEVIKISRQKDYTAVLIEDWAGKSWNIFDNNKEVK